MEKATFNGFVSLAPRVLAGLLAFFYLFMRWFASSGEDAEFEQYSSPAFGLLAIALAAFLVRLVTVPNRGRLVFALTLLCITIEALVEDDFRALSIWCWVVCLLISWDLSARLLSYAFLSLVGAVLVFGHPIPPRQALPCLVEGKSPVTDSLDIDWPGTIIPSRG